MRVLGNIGEIERGERGAWIVTARSLKRLEDAMESYGESVASYIRNAQLVGVVSTSRQIIAGAGLTGGGTLAADVTLNWGSSGTPNRLARWITATSLGNGVATDDGTNIYIPRPGSQIRFGSTTDAYSAGAQTAASHILLPDNTPFVISSYDANFSDKGDSEFFKVDPAGVTTIGTTFLMPSTAQSDIGQTGGLIWDRVNCNTLYGPNATAHATNTLANTDLGQTWTVGQFIPEVSPVTDNATDLGQTGRRWKNIYGINHDSKGATWTLQTNNAGGTSTTRFSVTAGVANAQVTWAAITDMAMGAGTISNSGNISMNGTSTVDGVDVSLHDHSTSTAQARLAAKDRRRLLAYRKDSADALASSTTAELALGKIGPEAVTHVNAYYIPDAALTANDTDYATLTVSRRTSAGATKTTLYSQTTKITGGTGNWTAFAAVSLGTVANAAEAADGTLTFEIAKTGLGVAVPAGTVVLEWTVD